MSFFRRSSTPEPPIAPEPIDAFRTPEVRRLFSPVYCDDQGDRVRPRGRAYTIQSWPERVADGTVEEFVASRRRYPSWDYGEPRLPYVQFYIHPESGATVCGLQALEPDLPASVDGWTRNDLGFVRGRIAVREGGDASLDDGALTFTGEVRVSYALWNGAFGVRFFERVIIGPMGTIEFVK